MKIYNGQNKVSQDTKLYEVIRSPLFETKFAEISKNYDRIHDIENAIDWALSRNPLIFTNIRGNYYAWKTEELIEGFPQLIISYEFIEEKDCVVLIDLEEIK